MGLLDLLGRRGPQEVSVPGDRALVIARLRLPLRRARLGCITRLGCVLLLGLALLMSAFAAAGLFVSSLTREPTIAAVGSFGLLLLVWLINILSFNDSIPFGEVFSYLSLIDHYENLRRGVFETTDVAYYLLFTALFLGLTVQRLDLERQ